MSKRTYFAALHADVTVDDDGTVTVEAYLGRLPTAVEDDPGAKYAEDVIAEDAERVREVLMASPLNHYLRTTLEK